MDARDGIVCDRSSGEPLGARQDVGFLKWKGFSRLSAFQYPRFKHHGKRKGAQICVTSQRSCECALTDLLRGRQTQTEWFAS